MNEWIKISETPIDEDDIHLLTDGESLILRGTIEKPCLIQLRGKSKAYIYYKFTHWMPLPKLPGDDRRIA